MLLASVALILLATKRHNGGLAPDPSPDIPRN